MGKMDGLAFTRGGSPVKTKEGHPTEGQPLKPAKKACWLNNMRDRARISPRLSQERLLLQNQNGEICNRSLRNSLLHVVE